MKHRLFKAVAGVLLVLCLMTLITAFGGGFNYSFGNPVSGGQYVVDFHGSIAIERYSDFHPILQGSNTRIGYSYSSWWEWLGLHFSQRHVVQRTYTSQTPLPGTFGSTTRFSAAVWWPLGLGAGFTFVFLTFRRRDFQSRKWVRSGCCGKCGYDLRATTDRCPECGTTKTIGA